MYEGTERCPVERPLKARMLNSDDCFSSVGTQLLYNSDSSVDDTKLTRRILQVDQRL